MCASKKDGYIKLYRSSLKNNLFSEKPFDRWHAFEWCLLMCRHEPGDVVIGNDIIHLDSGQFFTSLAQMSETFGWSVKKTRNFLTFLENAKMGHSEGHPKGQLITVENWALYQGKGQTQGQAKGTQGAGKGQVNKNGKNVYLINNSSSDNNTISTLNNNNINNILPGAQKINSGQNEPQTDGFIDFLLNDGTTYTVTMDKVHQNQMLYPAVDVEQAYRNMAGWLESNPKRRKTRRGIENFVTNWLIREQNRAHPGAPEEGKKYG